MDPRIPLIVSIPNPETLLFAYESGSGLENLLRVAASTFDHSGGTSVRPFALSGKPSEKMTAYSFSLRSDNRLFLRWKRLVDDDLAAGYSMTQKPLKTATNAFVAPHRVKRKQADGAIERISYTPVFEKLLPNLIPQADAVGLWAKQEARKPPTLPWQAFLSLMGPRAQETSHKPPRWLVSEFPSPEEIESAGPVPINDLTTRL